MKIYVLRSGLRTFMNMHIKHKQIEHYSHCHAKVLNVTAKYIDFLLHEARAHLAL